MCVNATRPLPHMLVNQLSFTCYMLCLGLRLDCGFICNHLLTAAHTHTCTHTYTHAHTHMHTHTYTHTHMHTHTRTHTHTHAHTHTHTRTHTHTHTGSWTYNSKHGKCDSTQYHHGDRSGRSGECHYSNELCTQATANIILLVVMTDKVCQHTLVIM